MSTKGREKVTRDGLPTCWVNIGKNYYYTPKGGKRVTYRQLPFVSEKYERLLSFMGIPYKREYKSSKSNQLIKKRVCVFWNPDFFETEKIELPLYVKTSTNVDEEELYIYTGESIAFDLPTTITIKKAYDIAKKVLQQIKKYEATVKQEKCWEYAKEILGDSDVALCTLKVNQEEMELKDENNHIKMFQIYNSENNPTRCYGVFNMEKIKYKDYIVVSVHEKIAGFIIGKGGKNKKNWEMVLGKKIIIDVI